MNGPKIGVNGNNENKAALIAALGEAQGELNRLTGSTQTAMETITNAFKNLASQADSILKQAGAIVERVQGEGMRNASSSAESLCEALRTGLEDKLGGATTILETLAHEEALLIQLDLTTSQQEAIAVRLKTLSVHTNVEAAYLGEAGGAFHILARELSEFSKSVSNQTHELANHTSRRKDAIEETRAGFASDLPRLRSEMARIDGDLRTLLAAIGAGLRQLLNIPGQFRSCPEETTRQIAGVVAAIQAHDITRQQVEHVQQALLLIIPAMQSADNGDVVDLAEAHAGLSIQVSQLKLIRETVTSWMSQIGGCMQVIEQLSASELVGVGPAVLKQERELSSHLAHIQSLQQKSQSYGDRTQQAEAGLSGLQSLVNDHLERTRQIRQSLLLLTFNSLIEANRLRERGAVVSSIGNLIKEVSAEWDEAIDNSRAALLQIPALLQQATAVMEAFSEGNRRALQQGQDKNKTVFDDVHEVATFVAKQAEQMQATTETMQVNAANRKDHLSACLAHLDTALSRLDAVALGLAQDDPRIAERYDHSQIERLFSGFYTTEIEREVMSAVLRGTPMPVLQQSFAGNDVELF